MHTCKLIALYDKLGRHLGCAGLPAKVGWKMPALLRMASQSEKSGSLSVSTYQSAE